MVLGMSEKKAGRGRPRSDAGLTARIALRTVPEDTEQLAAVAAKLPGFDQPTIARAALRLGLTLLDLEPELIVAGVGPAKQRRAMLKPHFTREP
ncbi:MAG: hypothetical protein JWM53_3016 [bacterium]|nr:hypothetical protein [bacterium]